jgi:Cft2 family RNA processing exonuclease
MPVGLCFHGVASTVTGSCYLIEHGRGRFLVDYGLFQGTKTIRELNYGPFPFSAPKIDYVLLTPAHTDHPGSCPSCGARALRARSTPPSRPSTSRASCCPTAATSRSSRSSG